MSPKEKRNSAYKKIITCWRQKLSNFVADHANGAGKDEKEEEVISSLHSFIEGLDGLDPDIEYDENGDIDVD